jgi:hypothetical protein
MLICSLLLIVGLCFIISAVVFIVREQGRGNVSRVERDSTVHANGEH